MVNGGKGEKWVKGGRKGKGKGEKGRTSTSAVAMPARQPWWPRSSFFASPMMAWACLDWVALRPGRLPVLGGSLLPASQCFVT